MKFSEVFSERRMAGRCEIKKNILLLEKRMTGCCKINRSIFFKKEWLVAVKLTKVFIKKRKTGRGKVN